ncbi:hypothetical protein [Ruegeria sp. R14_0]|uniref:hypothetical protein n=1 Tax=Ruegeria sp. R14_0 TaxID=2821100 RepID=UPI001AD9CCFB|nr:hypothetical protein [Ruegeria sp. R14_0]MBO9447192.1 hypothetical protein [Ruegeria sp. R14_0]
MTDKTAEIQITMNAALNAPHQRVTLCQTRQGLRFWLKRVERFAPHLWLVKGKPEQAFDRDRQSHRYLWNRGAAVPRILAEGADFIAVEDAGCSLTKLCDDADVATTDKLKAIRAAGHALARLHAMGLAHGRPAFRDMCWDGRQIRFIDFEYFSPSNAGRLRKARDVGIAILSALSQGLEGPRYAQCILSTYLSVQDSLPQALPVPCPVSNSQPRIRK